MKKKALKSLLQSLTTPPKSSSPLEGMYALMKEAEAMKKGDTKERFRAMDCHEGIMDLAMEGGAEATNVLFGLGMARRIGENQRRLGIA